MLADLQLFAMAQKTMDWAARRQTVLAENVANANTPGYQSKDVAPLSFRDALSAAGTPVQQAATNPKHLQTALEQPILPGISYDRNPIESKPDGNTVQLEDQMERIGQVKSRYELALNLFQKNMGMIKTALGRGGS